MNAPGTSTFASTSAWAITDLRASSNFNVNGVRVHLYARSPMNEYAPLPSEGTIADINCSMPVAVNATCRVGLCSGGSAMGGPALTSGRAGYNDAFAFGVEAQPATNV